MKTQLFLPILLFVSMVESGAQCYPDPTEPCWVAENSWFFENFSEPNDLPWERFRETYIGVAPDEFSSLGNFDWLLYELVYKSRLAKDGHCFGICLLAAKVLKYGGELGFCHPPYVYPGDSDGPFQEELRRVIQILHGYQLNHGFVAHALDVIANGEFQNGNYAFDQVEYYLSKGDPVILSMTSSLLPTDGGHSVLAYAAVDVPGDKKRIYVYDSNRSYFFPGRGGVEWYTADSNWVEIDQLSGDWSFRIGDDKVYEGHPLFPLLGGTIIATPLSIAGVRDRLPQSLFADALDFANKVVIVSGDAQLAQIRTSDGKQYLNPQTGQPDLDPQTGIRTVLPIVPLNGGKPLDPEAPRLYIVRTNAELEIDIESGGGAFEAGLIEGRTYANISGNKMRGRECFRFRRMQLSNPEVEIVNLAHAPSLNLRIMTVKSNQRPMEVYDLEEIQISDEASARIGINATGGVLDIHCEAGTVRSKVRFYKWDGQQPKMPATEIQVSGRRSLRLQSEGTSISPRKDLRQEGIE